MQRGNTHTIEEHFGFYLSKLVVFSRVMAKNDFSIFVLTFQDEKCNGVTEEHVGNI